VADAGLAVAGVAAVALIARYVVPPGIAYRWHRAADRMWFGYLFPPARLFEFVVGILLARSSRPALAESARCRRGAAVVVSPAVVVPAPYNFSLTTWCRSPPSSAPRPPRRAGQTHRVRRPVLAARTVSFGFYMVQRFDLLRRSRCSASHVLVPVALGLLVALFSATLLLAGCCTSSWKCD